MSLSTKSPPFALVREKGSAELTRVRVGDRVATTIGIGEIRHIDRAPDATIILTIRPPSTEPFDNGRRVEVLPAKECWFNEAVKPKNPLATTPTTKPLVRPKNPDAPATTVADIARRLGLDPKKARAKLRSMGFKFKGKQLTKDDLATVHQTLKELAE